MAGLPAFSKDRGQEIVSQTMYFLHSMSFDNDDDQFENQIRCHVEHDNKNGYSEDSTSTDFRTSCTENADLDADFLCTPAKSLKTCRRWSCDMVG